MRIAGFIPSRYGSTRFKAKALADIAGKPMVIRVYENAKKAALDDLFVLTDDQRIADICQKFNAQFLMTDPQCSSGTARILSIINKINCDIALNIQGDEPLVSANDLDKLINSFEDKTMVSTLITKINKIEDITNPNIVKVITDINDNAIYFSRSPIPYNRDKLKSTSYFQHIGIYAYRKITLQKFNNLKAQNLEKIEQLEQLRFLENNYKIKTVETKNIYIAVDLESDISEVEKYL
ncbi:MAG: 3-deoxy-manno-octulosonate cytidylyltransferase [bacterium]|nr:3-deoxy-manno-octulosonate cytidylyltransferase [bacterium]